MLKSFTETNWSVMEDACEQNYSFEHDESQAFIPPFLCEPYPWVTQADEGKFLFIEVFLLISEEEW